MRPGRVAAVGGGLAIADVIEAALELLPDDGGAVGPEAFAGGYLAEGVVLVNPIGGVGVGEADALIGGIAIQLNELPSAGPAANRNAPFII